MSSRAPLPTIIVPTDDPAALKDHRGLLWLISAALFMQTLDSTIVNTAVPSIAHALQVTPLSLKTALTAYVLALAVCVPAAPWLADRLGTRRVVMLSFSVFSIGSLACRLSQSLHQLVASRILQGIGGALMMPVGRYVLARSFQRRALVQAMSMVTMPAMLGPVLGPLLGGALSQFWNWRLIFLINLPVGVLALWLNRRYMPDIRGERQPFDFFGFICFAIASGLLMFSADRVSDTGLDLGVELGLIGGLAFGIITVWHLRRAAHPVADISLFGTRSFSIAVLGNIFTRLAVSGMPFVLVLFLQLGSGWSPLSAGMMLVPQALGMMLMKLFITRLVSTFGYRRTLFVNTLLIATMLACFSLLAAHASAWTIAGLTFAYGLSMSLQYTCVNTLAFADVRQDQAAHAASLTSTMQYLGISFGIAFASLLMQMLVSDQHQHAAGYVSAFHQTVWVLAGIALIAAFVFRQLHRDRPVRAAPVPPVITG